MNRPAAAAERVRQLEKEKLQLSEKVKVLEENLHQTQQQLVRKFPPVMRMVTGH